MSAWDVFVFVIQFLSPFAILMITLSVERKNKERDRTRNMADQLEDQKRNELKASMQDAADKLDKATAQINDLSDKLEQYSLQNEELRNTVNHIATLNKLNGRYTHEVAQLVMVLAEGIRDQHLDGNITRAIAKYRKFEQDALGAFITDNDDQLTK